MADSATLSARVLSAIDEVDAAAWDACAASSNPFVSHAFLAALEVSGSAGADAGWAPRHLAVEDAEGRLVAGVPMYAKSHSYGEYVFDHGWAAAFERAGGRYYPKLQVAVPFTPVTGPRLLVGGERPERRRAVIGALVEVARAAGVSSLHVTFPERVEWDALRAAGFLPRTGHQFYWHNRGYGAFDDFLADLASRKRKAIRRERREAVAAGIVIEVLSGAAIEPRHWDAFYRCYIATSEHKWGYPYLTRAFFTELGARLGDAVVLILASRAGRYVAGALNLRGGDVLYGRNWGCVEHHPFLHFELCYYRAIDYAIAHGLTRVEAGAQGEHKIARGYVPEHTFSAHWIAHEGLRAAVADYLDHERREIDAEVALLADFAPFRKDG